jgi:hypothetical protein
MTRLHLALVLALAAAPGCILSADPQPTPSDPPVGIDGPIWPEPETFITAKPEVDAFAPLGLDDRWQGLRRAMSEGAHETPFVGKADAGGRRLTLELSAIERRPGGLVDLLFLGTAFLFPTWAEYELTVTAVLRQGDQVVYQKRRTETLDLWAELFFVFYPPGWSEPLNSFALVDRTDDARVLSCVRRLTHNALFDLAFEEQAVRHRAQDARYQRAREALVRREVQVGDLDTAVIALIGEGPREPQPDGSDWLEYENAGGIDAIRFLFDRGGRLQRVVERSAGAATDWTARISPVTTTTTTTEPAEPTPAPIVAERPQPTGRTFILVIGIDDYQDPQLPDLRFAEADARAVFRYYAAHRRSPADRDRVLALTGAEATRAAVLQAIRQHLVQRATDPQDTVVLYFAGHGFADADESYLACADTTLTGLPETSISRTVLQSYWDRIPAGTKVLVTDACHAAGLASLRGVGGVRTLEPKREAPGSMSSGGFGSITIAATTETELSVEDAELAQGVFTTAFVTALQGDADADRDGVVTLGELAEYLRAEVPRHARAAGGDQRPLLQFDEAAATLRLTR